MQIESYRTRLEEFEHNLNGELYRYRAGLKDKLEIVTLYGDYSDLFCTESIREIESELKKESFESRRQSLERILRCLVDHCVDLGTAPLDEEAENIRLGQKISWEGKALPVAHAKAHLRSEPDAFGRRKLAEQCAKALEPRREIFQRHLTQTRSAAASLGFDDYVKLREKIGSVQYSDLLEAFEEVLSRFEDKYFESLKVSFETTLGIPFHEAGSWDIGYWEDRNDEPSVFAEGNLLGIVQHVITGLAVQPERKEAILLDLDHRPGKHPGAFCIPINIPDEIRVVVTPGNGSRHYAALLHESGHACHLAWTGRSLPAEYRIWGDRALSESYAFLLERFVQEREWLTRVLSFPRPERFLRFQALRRILLVRQWLGKLRFAIELHRNSGIDDAPQIYADTMRAYTGLQYLPESWPDFFQDIFTAADYLRGWAFEAMLRDYLRTKYGRAWSESKGASDFLKEIWETGFQYQADELCREIGLGDLEPQILAQNLAEELRY